MSVLCNVQFYTDVQQETLGKFFQPDSRRLSACAESEPFANLCRDTLMGNIKHFNQGTQSDIVGEGGIYFKEKWQRGLISRDPTV